MDPKDDIREFLTSRRARVTPEQVGLPGYGPRRVPGLRREEVAVLAGVSVPYYTKLERGDLSGVSAGVLEALARALHLDDAERAHLHDLARAVQPAVRPRARRRPAKRDVVRPGVQRLLDAITGAAAVVQNGRGDLLAANLLGRALYGPIFDSPEQPPNHARFIFLDPRSHELYPDWWEEAADITVALLRVTAGRNPYDRELSDLIGQLSTRSAEFRVRWASHDVRTHRAGAKRLRHPLVGELDLTFEVLDLTADDDLSVLAYSAEPGSASAAALDLLGSWAATEARTPLASERPDARA
ncbi:helix-turn-helix transcriptional regulator [Conexibacter stalactiti]|uniref:Helix-turn-helix transcriptional regulator n=1 Tax=Conexibacter stalactiti TaxID=1940611 RepID=A0ABU4HYD1_9ACTN|nr:helix-turn-helix transcriptional regulator [Conexibacter stalactiti]MDW5598313.1 helix-turn-helix transcriptional regulator [Conexibacter stalactiti]MEC5038955.1 helix-turn-helix transcriptional regulator [Conexibacter stalactiti]